MRPPETFKITDLFKNSGILYYKYQRFQKKKWSETLAIYSQNEALIISFQIKGHLAMYLSLKNGSIYKLPNLDAASGVDFEIDDS